MVNAKGGSGATTVAVNLALALQSAHGNVALVDMAPLGHAALHMNLKPLFTRGGRHPQPASPGQFPAGKFHDPAHRRPAAAGRRQHSRQLVEPSTAEFARLFDMLVSHFRYVVVDTSTRLDATTRLVCNLSETVLLVAHTDVASLWSAARIQQYLGRPAGGSGYGWC